MPMNYFALVNDGLEQTAEQEIKEKLKVKVIVNKNIVEFKTDGIENLPPPDRDNSKKNAEDALPSEKVEIQALEAKDGVFNLQEELEKNIEEDIKENIDKGALK